MTVPPPSPAAPPPGPQPALPGSYGQPPRGAALPADVRLGPVRLQVADLDRSLAFYTTVLGLRQVAPDGPMPAGTATLGTGAGVPLVVLVARPGTRPARPGQLGLYHLALLLPDRAALGHLVRHLAERGVRAAASDHLVSEALYLTDPDGLGIEVYADRPRASWRRRGRELVMTTERLDLAGLVRAAGEGRWTGAPDGTVVGHVHLHVGDLAAAGAFYGDALGLDRVVWSYPGALFLSAGGYHHHLGTNSWAGPDARPPAPDDARLLEWTLVLPDAAAVAAAAERLTAAGHAVARTAAGDARVADPWGTPLRLHAPGG